MQSQSISEAEDTCFSSTTLVRTRCPSVATAVVSESQLDASRYSDRELKRKFKELLGRSGLTARELADASGCTLDAAKLWIAGKRLPNLSSTINLSKRLPVIQKWVQDEMSVGVVAERHSPKLSELISESLLRTAWRAIIVHFTGPAQDQR